MSSRITAVVEHSTLGRTSVVILPPDIVAWERKTKSKMASGVAMGFEDVTFMAWRSLTRTGELSIPYDTWLEGVLDFDVVESESADPTGAAS